MIRNQEQFCQILFQSDFIELKICILLTNLGKKYDLVKAK